MLIYGLSGSSAPLDKAITTSSLTISTLVCHLTLIHNPHLLTGRLTDIEALAMVDEAYLDKTEWIKKSIRTTAKVCSHLWCHDVSTDIGACRWASSAPIAPSTNTQKATGTSRLRLFPSRDRAFVLRGSCSLARKRAPKKGHLRTCRGSFMYDTFAGSL